MSENSQVECPTLEKVDGRAMGSLKTAAKRIGVTLGEYLSRRSSGEKWCFICRRWLAIDDFNREASRGDGVHPKCKRCQSEVAKNAYTAKPRPQGRRFTPARDGDVFQARGRVNHLVKIGLLPDPQTLPCSACAAKGSSRHEYHHHFGYAAEHHESVVVLCSACHSKHHFNPNRKRDKYGRFN